MNGSPLAEDCDNYLGQIGDLNEDDLAMSTDRILEELNRRARQDVNIEDLIARSSIGAALTDIKERGIDAHLDDLSDDLDAMSPDEKALLAKIATTPPRKLNTRQEDAIKKPSVRPVNSRE